MVMLKKYTTLLLFLFALTSQGNSQTLNDIKEINEVWNKFYEAFDDLDYTLMAEIHSKRLIRISGGKRITDYENYIDSYKIRFQKSKKNKNTNNISLRFFERIRNDSIASERGIYKLIANKGKQNERTYYGQFHVILTKENGIWKILMDYDSNEANTIDEKDYAKAHGINDFDAFIKK